MKRFLPLLFAFALTLMLATPALAAGRGPSLAKGPAQFTVVGKITAIDATAKTVTIQVVRGNPVAKPYIGQAVTLKTTATTVFWFTSNGTTTTAITFGDLKVGDAVSASGSLASGVWTATRITVGAKLSCLP